MKKCLICILFLITTLLSAQESATDESIFIYIPGEQEFQYYMNLYARLNAIESGEMDFLQLKDFYDTFLKQKKYRETYQSLLLESYLLYTNNDDVKNCISDHIENNKYTDNFSKALLRLYKSKIRQIEIDNRIQTRYEYNDEFFDENINLFTMNEQYTFNNELGFMLFDNDYNIISIDPPKENKESFFINYGGGTNALLINFEKQTSITESQFDTSFLSKEFYNTKYQNYNIDELPRTGILARSGASKIYLGIGYGDDVFPEIENFSSVIYLYSNETKTAYKIDFFMNISEFNNNFLFRERIYNHLAFQCLLSFLNIL